MVQAYANMQEATLMADLYESVSRGLKRSSIQKCSRWAESYRILKGKRWTHDRYPWLRGIQDADSRMVIGQKAAQIGYTEAALNKTFFKIDIEHTDCLYVLPTENDASDFSSGRFDPALSESEHLRKMFSDVNNVGLKRAGNSTLYVRGGKSRSRLKSIPTGFIVLDEIDEMPEENIPLVLERFSGQEIKQCMMISTPTVHGHGINKYYLKSTMEHFFFECPCCGEQIELKFPENVEITADSVTDKSLLDSYYFCDLCKGRLEHEHKTEWLSTGHFVAEYPDRPNRGFSVNQLYSPTIKPWELAEAYLKSLYDPTEEQEFYNSKLGMTHIVGDARITQQNIDDCKKNYMKGAVPTTSVITMGVDVGAKWHYEICEWHMTGQDMTTNPNDIFECRVLDEGEIDMCDSVTRIVQLLERWNVRGCVIDRHPQTYAVYKITARYPGLVYACMFGRGGMGRRITIGSEDTQMVTVDRTSWFDCALGRVMNGKIALPRNISLTYQRHLQVPARVYLRDSSGNPIGKWVSETRNDHFALTRVYSEVALCIALENIQPQSMENIF